MECSRFEKDSYIRRLCYTMPYLSPDGNYIFLESGELFNISKPNDSIKLWSNNRYITSCPNPSWNKIAILIKKKNKIFIKIVDFIMPM